MSRLMYKFVVVVFSSILITQSHADQGIDGFYMSAFGGILVTPKLKPAPNTSAKLKMIGHYHLVFGNKSEGSRWELEIPYYSQSADLTGTVLDGDKLSFNLISLFVNYIYDFDYIRWPVYPSIGLGAGYAFAHGEKVVLGTSDNFEQHSFAGQFILQMNYNINSNISAFVDTRFLITPKLKSLNSEFYKTLAFSLGLHFRFG